MLTVLSLRCVGSGSASLRLVSLPCVALSCVGLGRGTLSSLALSWVTLPQVCWRCCFGSLLPERDIIIDLAVAGNVYHSHQIGHYYILVVCIANYAAVFHRVVLRGAINSLLYFFPL